MPSETRSTLPDDRVFHQGEDVALLLRAHDRATGEGTDLTAYEAEVFLYSTYLGRKVRLSTAPADEGALSLARIDDKTLGANLPGALTRTLTPGLFRAEIALVHRASGTREIVSTPLFLLKPSKNEYR